MNLRVEFHELADLDLFEAWTWYEDQQHGLGDRFLGAIDATVHRAARWPNGVTFGAEGWGCWCSTSITTTRERTLYGNPSGGTLQP